MTGNRNLSLPAHGTIDLAAGLATIVAPVVLGFDPAGIVTSFVLGTLLIGMSLPLSAAPGAALAWHREFDSLFLIGAAGCALALALAGQAKAGVFFAALVVLQSGLNLVTRYATVADAH